MGEAGKGEGREVVKEGRDREWGMGNGKRGRNYIYKRGRGNTRR